jgi:hypothetical protein
MTHGYPYCFRSGDSRRGTSRGVAVRATDVERATPLVMRVAGGTAGV